jgi:hypothetical protein
MQVARVAQRTQKVSVIFFPFVPFACVFLIQPNFRIGNNMAEKNVSNVI